MSEGARAMEDSLTVAATGSKPHMLQPGVKAALSDSRSNQALVLQPTEPECVGGFTVGDHVPMSIHSPARRPTASVA